MVDMASVMGALSEGGKYEYEGGGSAGVVELGLIPEGRFGLLANNSAE